MLSGPITHRDTGQQLLAAAWPCGCLMIDNLLNIQILVFVPPTLVCVWGGVQYGLYLRCAAVSTASARPAEPRWTQYSLFTYLLLGRGPGSSWGSGLGHPIWLTNALLYRRKIPKLHQTLYLNLIRLMQQPSLYVASLFWILGMSFVMRYGSQPLVR